MNLAAFRFIRLPIRATTIELSIRNSARPAAPNDVPTERIAKEIFVPHRRQAGADMFDSAQTRGSIAGPIAQPAEIGAAQALRSYLDTDIRRCASREASEEALTYHGVTMPKGQQRSNREAKKPKQTKTPTPLPASAPRSAAKEFAFAARKPSK